MLSRKPGSGLLSAAVGLDRGRVGERLQAALAGLQELQFLKEKQTNMVHWALRMEREEPLSPIQPGADGAGLGTEEQRLEATLTALKQQLSRLRRQDMGLKNHLQQLDQQISELKLDVCKVSTEHLESDSRPSSGFYELSDGGSGSLSNSCTSVYSESLSSSQTSLPPQSYGASGHSEASRRRSADESAAQADPPRGSGVRLGSTRIRTGAAAADRARQRPVSTGDLDRMMSPNLGLQRSVDVKKSSLCHHTAADSKYQSTLVSRSGAEVYHYPSPLHAVALQSPIFSLGGEVSTPAAGEAAGSQAEAGTGIDPLCEQPEGTKGRPVGYIDKLLQRSLSRVRLHNQTGRQRAVPSASIGGPGIVSGLASRAREQTGQKERPLEAEKRPSATCQELAVTTIAPSGPNRSEKGYTSLRLEEEGRGIAGLEQCSDLAPRGQALARRPSLPRSSSMEEGRDPVKSPPRASQPEFVHAQFVPAGSQRVRVKRADRRTKAVRLRRRSCEKPRVTKPPQEPNGSADRQLDGVTSPHFPRLQPQREATPKPIKAHRQPGPDLERLSTDLHRRKQGARKWQSEVEIGTRPTLTETDRGQRCRDAQSLGVTRRTGLVRSLSVRPSSGNWGSPPHPHPPSASSACFSSSNSWYPPAPFPAGLRAGCPPRSESQVSEYSADCASLFHSTIAESSEGDLSDFTTNRFGDSESSQDSHSSLSLEEEDIEEEEEEEEGPTASGLSQHQPCPEPPACRIKASRALKKKIRRFQPAAMKVMTLV